MKANTVKLVIQPRLRFHEIVRRKNNPNKETLIYIPYSSRCRNLNVYNPNCKTTQQIINSTLLLLLVRPIYLDMCPSIPIHIHPYMSIPRLLLETDDETMVMFTVSPVHTWNHDPGRSNADSKLAARETKGGSYIIPIQEGASAPLGTPGGPQVESKV